LCADKGYSGKPAAAIMRVRGYVPHVKQRGAGNQTHPRTPAAGPALEGGTNAFVVQPFQQIAGAIRKENGKLLGLAALRLSLDLLADVLKFVDSLFRDKILIPL